MTREPRYLFRRFVALLVDGFLAALVAVALMAPFVAVMGTDNIRFGNAPIRVNQCGAGETITEEMLELLGKMPVQVSYCRTWVFGLDNGLTAEVILSQSRNGNVTRTHSATVSVSDLGTPVWPGAPDVPLAVALMVIGSAAFLARAGRRTPGKALVGLDVYDLAGRADALRREGIRWMPVMVLAFFEGVVGFFPSLTDWPTGWTWAQTFWTGLGFGLPLLAFMLWYYIVPFFTGDHRARWDRMVGSRVTRS